MIEKPPIAVEKIRSSAEPEMTASALETAATLLPPRLTTFWFGIERLAGGRVGALHDAVEELVRRADVVLDAELLQVGPVDEDQLGLDRDGRRLEVEAFDELADRVDAGPGVDQDQRVGRGIRR